MRTCRGRRFGQRLIKVFGLMAVLGLAAPTTTSAAPEPWVRVIVRFRDGGAPLDVRTSAALLVGPSGGRLTALYEHAVRGFAAEMPAPAAAALAHHRWVAAVSPDQIVSIDADDPEVPTGIDRIEGDRNVASGAVDVDIAIIDSGVQAHPDLNLVAAVDCTPWWGLLGCVDGNQGTIHWHGTHVAGIAAARDNGSGVEGAAPGARIWSVRVLDAQGSGSLSQIIQGIDWVTARADVIDVANMSLGGAFSDSTFDAAISNSIAAGVVYAVAAGNDGQDAAGFSPANHPQVITVSAIADSDGLPGALGGSPSCRPDEDDTLADFSNYGAAVDVAAPGVCVLSTYTGNGYATASGTSMASPHVAGVIARYLAADGVDPRSAADVAAVRTAIVGAAIPQADACGFSGDRDPYPEPLVFLNASALGGDGSCGAAPANDAPVIAWDAPAVDATVAGGVVVAATVTDAEDPAIALVVEYRAGGGAWQSMSAGPGDSFGATWDTTTAADGPAILEIRATDTAANSTSALRSVIVDNLPNQQPSASFNVSCSGLACAFDASTSADPDGSITSYAWQFGDGAAGSGKTASHTYASGGTRTVTLTVTDDEAASTSTTQNVTVVQPATMQLGTVSAELAGKRNTDLVATVQVLANGAPVSGAAVSGHFEVNGGVVPASATTGTNGVATLQGGKVRRLDLVTYFCVDAVTATGRTLTTSVPYCVLVYP